MPGSLIKPILALALLHKRDHDAAHPLAIATLQQMLRRSLSEEFMDEIFCKSAGFENCGNLQRVAEAAGKLGWNPGCSFRASEQCGKVDPFLAMHAHPSSWIQGASILTLPQTAESRGRTRIEALNYPERLARECAARKWSRCDGATFAELSAEMWGQGNAMASPAGIAEMFQRLARAADGFDTAQTPRLVSKVTANEQTRIGAALLATMSTRALPDLSVAKRLDISKAHAEVILGGLSLTHKTGGTAHSACVLVFGSAKNCDAIDWIASKTATPVYTHDRMTLAARRAHCAALDEKIAAHVGSNESKRKLVALRSHCVMLPYKWYAAALKEPGKTGWSKVVVAIVERNYDSVSGMVDASEDKGANLAAVLALQYARLWRERLAPNGEARFSWAGYCDDRNAKC